MPYTSRSKSYQSIRRPTLDDVLSNTSTPPYTLSAFILYLSENHCLENLQFTLAAKRYCELYNSFVDQTGESVIAADSSASKHLHTLYRLLLTTYVMPGAPREVNLSVKVRDSLLRHKDLSTPPLPEILNPGLESIHELMENSIFPLFLNSRDTSSCRVSMSEEPNSNDVRPDCSDTSSDNQSTPRLRLHSKRPSLNRVGRTWSWPPWSRQPN